MKKYFQLWDFMRVFRLVLALILFVGYLNNGELFLLFGGIFLFLQAVLNISCPGGSCGTANKSETGSVYKFKKYQPKK